MRIKRFNESNDPHELTDYILEWIEDEGFKYEPSGSHIRLFYSGESKSESIIFNKYLTLLKRLEPTYGVSQKSIRIEESQGTQAIEIRIQLDRVDDFKVEFQLHDRVFSGDITSCQLMKNINWGIVGFKINLSNVSFRTGNKTAQLRFYTAFTGPFTNKNCRREIIINPTDMNSPQFSIDTKNVEKILNIIKSRNIRFIDTPQLEECLLLLDNINPDDLSNL